MKRRWAELIVRIGKAWRAFIILDLIPITVPSKNTETISGAHTGFFNGRGTGLKAAMSPKVTLPKNRKLLEFGPLFWVGSYFYFF